MKNVSILWTDDEIDLLKPHILFLESKGYNVETASNGDDAILLVSRKNFDIIFLDENMPGKSGLETLTIIKSIQPEIPIVMITKSEEEDIMDAAIGSQIDDYLIKPVNPKQILLSIKKNIETKKLVSRKTTSSYQSSFKEIGLLINSAKTFDDWANIYTKLTYWELEIEKSEDNTMMQVINMQKSEANIEFGKFIRGNYLSWFEEQSPDAPLISPDIMQHMVFPELKKKEKIVFILIDNLRYDQWRLIKPLINESYTVEKEEIYCSILPTATQYSRNAIFSGMMPSEIQSKHPDLWLNDHEEGLKNQHEEELFLKLLAKHSIKAKCYYGKISSNKAGLKTVEKLDNILQNDIVLLVYNFVDMLSHANADTEMIRELASNDPAYRSLTLSWFQHSHLFSLLKSLAEKGISVVLTTDHGTIRVNRPVKVIGDRTTSKNLRYKLGKNLSYNKREVFEITKPSIAQLPKTDVNSKYIFAYSENFFAYPNNYNYYVNYFTNTYQHGGISMEEMILPLVRLKAR